MSNPLGSGMVDYEAANVISNGGENILQNGDGYVIPNEGDNGDEDSYEEEEDDEYQQYGAPNVLSSFLEDYLVDMILIGLPNVGKLSIVQAIIGYGPVSVWAEEYWTYRRYISGKLIIHSLELSRMDSLTSNIEADMVNQLRLFVSSHVRDGSHAMLTYVLDGTMLQSEFHINVFAFVHNIVVVERELYVFVNKTDQCPYISYKDIRRRLCQVGLGVPRAVQPQFTARKCSGKSFSKSSR